MGDLVSDPVDPTIANGFFDDDSVWQTSEYWSISAGYASDTILEGMWESQFWQYPNLIVGVEYKVVFDILIADFAAGSGLQIRIQHSPYVQSPVWSTAGQKIWYFTPTKDANYFMFRIDRYDLWPSYVRIDNVVCEPVDSALAYIQGLHPMAGTKSETLDISPVKSNITLAHWNGKSNVLIEIEK